MGERALSGVSATPSAASTDAGTSVGAVAGASSSETVPQAGAAAAVEQAPRLGRRGLLDPLLFLCAPGNAVDKANGTHAAGPGAGEDLKAVLQKAEAEYAAIPGLLTGAGQSQPPVQRGRQPHRGRAGGSGDAGSRQGSLGREQRGRGRTPPRGREATQQPRGKKRRPVSQEPRPVSTAAPPPRKVQAFAQVEDFLKETGMRCQKFALQATFRAIKFGQQQKKKAEAKAPSALPQVNGAASKPQLSPWEEYFRANNHFIRRGQFMAVVAWDVHGRRVLAIVPHEKWVSKHHLARAVQKPESAIVQCKLKDLEKETGFTTFVCPPIGHPKDKEGRLPLLLVDSTVTELKKPLLFDCGTVGLSIMPNEFVSLARATCVEGLAKDPPAKDASTKDPPEAVSAGVSNAVGQGSSSGAAENTAQPEASNEMQVGETSERIDTPLCGPPQTLAPNGV